MKPEVESWLAFAKQTQGILQEAIRGFEVISATYVPMRDVGFEDDEKEAIDAEYVKLNELKEELAGLQAGGKRSKKRKTRKTLRK